MRKRLRSEELLFVRHDVEDGVVDLVHAVVAEAAEVTDRAVYIAFAEAVGSVDNAVVIGEFGTDEGTVESGAHFECATGFGAIANHAGNGVDHVLDSVAHLLEGATVKVDNAAGDPDAGVDDAAKRAESAYATLDIDGHEMVENEGTDKLLLGAAFGLAIVVDGKGAGYALVAAAAVAVDGEGAAVHAGVGGCHRAGDNGMDDVACGVLHKDFAGIESVAFKAFGGGGIVVFNSLFDELEFFNGSCGGIVVDHTGRELELVGSGGFVLREGFKVGRGGGGIAEDVAIAGNEDEMGVALADDGRGSVAAGSADAFNVEFLALFLDTDGNPRSIVGKPCLAFLDLVGGECEHFESPTGVTRDNGEGDGDGEAYHACARDADTHGIFEHVLAEENVDVFRLTT